MSELLDAHSVLPASTSIIEESRRTMVCVAHRLEILLEARIRGRGVWPDFAGKLVEDLHELDYLCQKLTGTLAELPVVDPFTLADKEKSNGK